MRRGSKGLLVSAVLAASLLRAQTHVNVTTWHNDNGRTGQNTSETALKPGSGSVDKATFGKICSYKIADGLDGQVYAQPLVVWDSTNSRNVAYVVTMNDSIYAFDGTNSTGHTCTLIAKNTQLIPSTEAPAECDLIGGMKCKIIDTTVGVLGTPVIDATTNTIYLVTESQSPPANPNTWYHRIHALDATTLQEKSSYHGGSNGVVISGQVFGGLSFVSRSHIQRPGLLLLPGIPSILPETVYIAFSMMDGDTGNPNGWIFSYNAQDLSQSPLVYSTTPMQNAIRGGIWQGGAGLAAGNDANGGPYIYFSTGDGTFDLYEMQTPHTDSADAFIKLNPNLTFSSYFAPSDAYWRGCTNPFNDKDFGSGGVILLPDSTFSGNLYAVKADKENKLWVIDRTNPGGYTGNNTGNHCGSQISCTNACMNADNNTQTVGPLSTNNEMKSSPAFWGGNNGTNYGMLYAAASGGPLYGYAVGNCSGNNPVLCPSPASSTVSDLGYAATPSVSSNGTGAHNSTGIVWTLDCHQCLASGGVAATLHAFNANPSNGNLNEVYNSDLCHPSGNYIDQPGLGTKFSIPSIANGFVYIGTETDFDIYGIVPNRSCT
jgi:hypothetical protein